MDTNYQKFIWSTIKEHCFTSFIGFLLVAFAMAVLMMVHVRRSVWFHWMFVAEHGFRNGLEHGTLHRVNHSD